MDKYKNLIGGKLIEPSSGEYFDNIDPADKSDIVGKFPKSNAKDVEAAIEAAKNAYAEWSDMPPPRRGELIYKVGELLMRDQKKLAEIIVHENGKPTPAAMGDIKSSADVAYFMAGEGRRMYGQTTYSSLPRRWALTKRYPVGVCGLITAWNAPMAIITWKLFPALICGNTVVLKPSEDTPLTAHYFGELVKEVGIPDGVVNIVYGSGPGTGEALVKNQDVKLVSFTGSSQVGVKISEECGKQNKTCSLEMGGKNGLIVMPDADLKTAAKAVAAGAFSTAGQRCAATSRVFIHEQVYEMFMELLLAEAKADSISCPIINKRQFDRILSYIEEGKKSGAKLAYGGNALAEGKYAKGYYIEPTIFTDVNHNSKLAQEEIFGPVLCVFKIKSLGEGIKMVNSVDYGLTASIFTKDVDSAVHAMDKLEAGCCYINGPTFGSEPHMPFGGLKKSGNSHREPGTQAVDVFSEWKTIYIDYSGIAQQSQYKMK
ncbi:MAG: aldehyde dehydrogenase family protein [Candidatus Margulisiibacteriota bacterium]|nr:aldehyde dehydrogenase family protein [Candidatus Margulisiibacteriota bacterium]